MYSLKCKYCQDIGCKVFIQHFLTPTYPCLALFFLFSFYLSVSLASPGRSDLPELQLNSV